ncbi:hypothetical protein FACS1894142_2540 [Spirochaetia bacterium]|nr:hypothetical protein FACS1894142_2540 [Spirochaetia bacterium]
MGMKTLNNEPEPALPDESPQKSESPTAEPRGEPPINWHPAFFEAIQLELADYKDVLSFQVEYQLNKAPLKLDILIIKKDKDAVIGKNIASFFRGHNIFEYKSPDKSLSVSDFYKAYAYVCLYASLEEVPITDLTLSFVETRYPREVLRHLCDTRGCRIEKPQAGIYHVSGDIIPIQIIESRKLSTAGNIWLKDLSNELDRVTLAEIASKSAQLNGSHIGTYIKTIMQANKGAAREVLEMSDMTMEEIFEETGWAAHFEKKAEARGRLEGKAEGKASGLTEGQHEKGPGSHQEGAGKEDGHRGHCRFSGL